MPIRRALLSVSNKQGLASFATALQQRGVELLSTGGTARLLVNEGLRVREVSEYTGFPELMDGRLKTLHSRVHGGLLGRRGIDDADMAAHGIEPIDLLVVNLYPFAETIARPDCTYEEAIEHIDVGGPAMLRAGAKNHEDVTVLVDPADYDEVLQELDASGETSIDTRARLAAKAFAHTARYDTIIAGYLQRRLQLGLEALPDTLVLYFDDRIELRYGENPHQRAAFYRDPGAPQGSVAGAQRLQGKELSFNNIADADAAIECVRRFDAPACVIVKHANPCGVAVAASALQAYESAYRTDPTSAYGAVIAFNRELDGAAAQAILSHQFAELIAAPAFAAEARALLASKPELRVLATGPLRREPEPAVELRSVTGGLLAQDRDELPFTTEQLRIVSRRQPEARERGDLLFAWQVVQFVKSNAIVLVRDSATIGVGAGQMSRVDAARIAVMKAADHQLDTRGSVMASDAFFPFRDSIDVAAACGVRAVIQPGGSRRDAEIISAADEHDMVMALTGVRHFRH